MNCLREISSYTYAWLSFLNLYGCAKLNTKFTSSDHIEFCRYNWYVWLLNYTFCPSMNRYRTSGSQESKQESWYKYGGLHVQIYNDRVWTSIWQRSSDLQLSRVICCWSILWCRVPRSTAMPRIAFICLSLVSRLPSSISNIGRWARRRSSDKALRRTTGWPVLWNDVSRVLGERLRIMCICTLALGSQLLRRPGSYSRRLLSSRRC